MRNGTDRLRAVNVPQPAVVELDAGGSPAKIEMNSDVREPVTIEAVREIWRIDDEWRSEERRVGKECRSGGAENDYNKKDKYFVCLVVFETSSVPTPLLNAYDFYPYVGLAEW